ncbi:MAG TPA: cytidine deaminase [Candidatus Eisenbacteria bacterium]|nr:cytidine deaminase [Candidatus Eisenbacteria bacterium]
MTPEAKSAVSDSLVAEARRVLAHAHAPYSRFPVGAALLTESGKVFTATNVENASFGLSVCAERSAVFAAVAAGERRFSALAVVTDTPEPTPPCGACRQVLREFVEDLPVALAGRPGTKVQMHRLSDLLPQAFSPPIDGRSFTA